ncbi:MAG: neutral/alkaline non-lysosomal ceramidase N-terminal domain-containing protein [Planctomycetes bacterium]|nr:neutral/alkaline non-lysosomal ceramidase N-terminal domain-containing protein [Planctomycetota bacterium]
MSHTCLAGVGRADLTPPMGLEMCGYGPHLKRKGLEVRDPLAARALLVSDGEQKVLFLTCDLIGLDEPAIEGIRRAIESELGVPSSHILVACSHAHSCPATMFTVAWGKMDEAYMASLPARCLEAARAASNSLEPARIGYRRQRIHGVGVNRVQPDFGPLDPAAQLLRVDRASGKPLALLFNFGAHPVVRYPFTWRISADWPGVCSRLVSDAFDGAETLFLLGPCGNINGNQMDFSRNDSDRSHWLCDERVEDTARSLFQQIARPLKTLETVPEVRLQAAHRRISFPQEFPDTESLKRFIAENQKALEETGIEEGRDLRDIQEDEPEAHARWRRLRFQVDHATHRLRQAQEKRPPWRSIPLEVLKVGPAAFVSWPGEIYVELGIELRQRSPVPMTFVASLAGGSIGYVVTPAVYESQGRPNQFGPYEGIMAATIYGHYQYRPECGPLLIQHTLDTLQGLVSDGR